MLEVETSSHYKGVGTLLRGCNAIHEHWTKYVFSRPKWAEFFF